MRPIMRRPAAVIEWPGRVAAAVAAPVGGRSGAGRLTAACGRVARGGQRGSPWRPMPPVGSRQARRRLALQGPGASAPDLTLPRLTQADPGQVDPAMESPAESAGSFARSDWIVGVSYVAGKRVNSTMRPAVRGCSLILLMASENDCPRGKRLPASASEAVGLSWWPERQAKSDQRLSAIRARPAFRQHPWAVPGISHGGRCPGLAARETNVVGVSRRARFLFSVLPLPPCILPAWLPSCDFSFRRGDGDNCRELPDSGSGLSIPLCRKYRKRLASRLESAFPLLAKSDIRLPCVAPYPGGGLDCLVYHGGRFHRR